MERQRTGRADQSRGPINTTKKECLGSRLDLNGLCRVLYDFFIVLEAHINHGTVRVVAATHTQTDRERERGGKKERERAKEGEGHKATPFMYPRNIALAHRKFRGSARIASENMRKAS